MFFKKASSLGILKKPGKDVKISPSSTLPQRRSQLRWREYLFPFCSASTSREKLS
ncbi:unnamed protein product [Chondrus crispus]|uniref:Uncharacterized protein n=1 Tax=Chondrus crispus TaxID=2769 RepID=R7QQ34_CHOCR|nr:unnamed protein product [Chondrus crispus]CDF39586.1 unnamed protein product [Chondrus crispus]|eukprot:XP_005709880.1 unnamed protein product [Chondrus crispus]